MFRKYALIVLNLVYVLCSQAESLDLTNYDEKVLLSKEAWLVEYYSERCGTCQEFSQIWSNATKKIKKLRIGKVNIDNENGMELAKKNNILDEGIPCVQLIYGSKGERVTILAGEVLEEHVFLGKIKKYVNIHLTKSVEMYMKEDL